MVGFGVQKVRHKRCSILSLRGDHTVKSWGILIVSAMGFLAGMILAGVGGLLAKTNPSVIAPAEMTLESYWTETSLGTKELFELVSNTNCQSSEKYFLACVNSVLQVLPKYHLELSDKTGKLVALQSVSSRDGFSEKENLIPFIKMYEKQLGRSIDFQSVWLEILKNQRTVDSRSLVIGTGINGFFSVYKDPHTYIMPSRYYEEVSSNVERSNLFIGVSFEKKDSGVFVRKVFAGSDAEASGLAQQDQLLELNKIPVDQLTMVEINSIFRDAKNKYFDLKVLRQNNQKDLKITRSYRVLKHVSVQKKSGLRDYAIVTVSKFNSGVCAEVASKIKDFSQDMVSGLILDLRDNPGGQLDEAACVAGLFVGMNKKLYSVKYFDPLKANEVVLTTGSLLYTGPLVVLVNSSSASASELLAGALQDYNRAVIVGERTFGKGTFQEAEVWNKNQKLYLFKTQGFYLLPGGESPQLKGILPDFFQAEAHLQQREETNYFNPITPEKYLTYLPAPRNKNYTEEFEKCLPSLAFHSEDAVLDKGLEVLSCHRISSFMATQFAGAEFNQ